MAICLYEEKGGFRVYDQEAGRSSSTAEKAEDLLKTLPRNREIRLYISLEAFSIRKAVLPNLEREKMREVLPFEMEGLFLGPASSLAYDFYPLKPSGDGTECLVFALNRETAQKHVAPFVQAGLNIVSLSPLWDSRLSEDIADETVFYQTVLDLAPSGLTGENKKRKAMDVYRAAFIYAVAVLLVFLAGLSIRYFLILKKEAGLEKEVSAVYASMFPGQKMPPDLYYGVQSKLVELKQNYSAFKGTDVLGMLKSVSESSRDGVKVKEINMEADKATLKGEGADYSAVEQFRDNLKKRFGAVQLLETKTMQDGKSRFALEVTGK